MGKYMEIEDTFIDFLSKIKIKDLNTYDALTKEEIMKIVKTWLKDIVVELYNLELKQASFLSERDTYIIRKIYGVLDNGVCEIGSNVGRLLGVGNVGGIKMHYFKRLNENVNDYIREQNLEKKKRIVLDTIGIKNPKYLEINARLGLYDEAILLDKYYLEHSIDELMAKIKDYKVFIKNSDDLKKFGLDEKSLQILKLRFGLQKTKGKTLKEVGNLFNVSRERIRQIEAESIRTIRERVHFNIHEDNLTGPIKGDSYLRITRRILKDIRLDQIEELVSVPEEVLFINLGEAVLRDLEIERNKKGLDKIENANLTRRIVVKRVARILKDINSILKIDIDKAMITIEDHVKTLKLV